MQVKQKPETMNIKAILLSLIFVTGSLAMQSCGGGGEQADQETAEKEAREKDRDKKADKKDKDYATAEFFVRGNCEMCKERIEAALSDVNGVKRGKWNVESSDAKVKFNADKVSEEDLHNAVAGVGHRTNEVDADEEAYADLPPCCLDPDDEDYIEM